MIQRIYHRHETRRFSSEAIARGDWTAIVPAAGRGSRLGIDYPKILYPIAGKSIGLRILEILEGLCQRAVLVVSPEGETTIHRELSRYGLEVELVYCVQPQPVGMADAVLRARKEVETRNVMVVWGDQIMLKRETVEICLRAHQSLPQAAVTLPTVYRNGPYIDFQRDPEGVITAVHQAREGEIANDIGENDCGFFCFNSNALFSKLVDAQNKLQYLGTHTQEFNLLPLIPEFEGKESRVYTLQIASEEETWGINTKLEAERASDYLRTPAGRSSRRDRPYADRILVVVFSGGRGTTSICEALSRHDRIEVVLVANAYDDGLSTGALRRYIPGMLGPSDIRKSVSRLIPGMSPKEASLKALLEYRIPEGVSYAQAVELIRAFSRMSLNQPDAKIGNWSMQLPLWQTARLSAFAGAFLDCVALRESESIQFNFCDCAFGNILFAGCFLSEQQDFNSAVRSFSAACGLPGQVFNVTQGEPLVLVGVKEDGQILTTEAEIVAPQSSVPIREIFLLPAYPIREEIDRLNELPLEAKMESLRQKEILPRINANVRSLLENSDIIIYGPGTQHSSLFPSYLTLGLSEAIAANHHAVKIYISNIIKDNDIRGETACSVVDKLFFYMSRKNPTNIDPARLVNRYLFQQPESTTEVRTSDYLEFDSAAFKYGREKALLTNWESREGKHLGGHVLSELISIVNSHAQISLKPSPYMLSIIVPALKEERTVRKVLHDLVLLDFAELGIDKEIIFVDGGSADRTFEEASMEKSVRAYRPGNISGRGDALRFGIQQAHGNIIAFFPSDDEYDASELASLVLAVVKNEFRVVFGSRAIKCVDLSDRIRDIYSGDHFGYLWSKYGGMALSFLSYYLYNRYISDPLTGMKVFDGELLRALELCSSGLDLETEIVAKVGQLREFILELPVTYRPRTRLQGKKTTVWGGLRALVALWSRQLNQQQLNHIKSRFPGEKDIHRHSRV